MLPIYNAVGAQPPPHFNPLADAYANPGFGLGGAPPMNAGWPPNLGMGAPSFGFAYMQPRFYTIEHLPP